jgi:hypothetical protein
MAADAHAAAAGREDRGIDADDLAGMEKSAGALVDGSVDLRNRRTG